MRVDGRMGRSRRPRDPRDEPSHSTDHPQDRVRATSAGQPPSFAARPGAQAPRFDENRGSAPRGAGHSSLTVNLPNSDPQPGHSSRDLLEHAAWLRRLARALVRDEARAEDLVQDSLRLVAGRPATVRDVRGFLAGTVRRLAQRELRSDTRRRRREERVAVEEALPDTALLVERVELLRAVLHEIERLPEAQQRAVTLRFLDGLEPSEIARADGVAPGTVRANLAKGLARLRERLDREGGGRDAWCMVLAPFAGMPRGTPLGEGLPGPEVSTGAATVAGGGALLALGAFSLSTATASLILVPVALLGAWLAFGRGPGELAAGIAVDRVAGQVPAVVHRPHSIDGSPPMERRAVPVQPTDMPRDEEPLALERSPLGGQVLDAHTGEPVPAFAFEVHAGANSFHMVTGADGSFLASDALEHGSVLLVADPSESPTASPWPEPEQPFPFDGPLHVVVGPTFFLDLVGPDGWESADLQASLVVAGRDGGRAPLFGASRLRSGALPWVRFAQDLEMALTTEQRELVVTDTKGHWQGTAPVFRGLGVEPRPVRVELKETGAIEFELAGPDADYVVHHQVHLRRAGSAESQRRLIRTRTAPGQAPDDRLVKYLEPGTYEWTLGEWGDQPVTGTVEVRAGKTHVVPIEIEPATATFDTVVTVTYPGAKHDLSGSWIWVTDPDSADIGFNGEIERDPDGGDGAWRIVLNDLPAQPWRVVLHSSYDNIAFEPSRVAIGPGVEPKDVRVVTRGRLVDVSLGVRSALTGDELPLASVGYSIDGLSSTSPGPSVDGGLKPLQLPEDHETRIVVGAPGHRSVKLLHRPSRDGRKIELRLEEGWANFVMVWDLRDMAPLPGAEVVVDGVVVGTTGADGQLWLDRDTAPGRVEARMKGFVLARDENHAKEGAALRSIFGLNFLLKAE